MAQLTNAELEQAKILNLGFLCGYLLINASSVFPTWGVELVPNKNKKHDSRITECPFKFDKSGTQKQEFSVTFLDLKTLFYEIKMSTNSPNFVF